MIRNLIAGAVGWLVMVAAMVVLFSVAYLAMGTEGAFKVGSLQVSGAWMALNLFIGLGAALLGGLTCERIANTDFGIKVLVGVILVLGIFQLIQHSFLGAAPETLERVGEVSVWDAGLVAVVPGWAYWINPLVHVAGVLIGRRLAKSSS